MTDKDIPGGDLGPDPIDGAYAQAEAHLDDDNARSARRARVLAAMAREPVADPVIAVRRSFWRGGRGGGWLAAACVAGLSVLVVTRQPPPHLSKAPAGLVAAKPSAMAAAPETRAEEADAAPSLAARDAAPAAADRSEAIQAAAPPPAYASKPARPRPPVMTDSPPPFTAPSEPFDAKSAHVNSAPAQEMAGNLSTEADAQRSREGPASSLSRSAMAPSPALAQPDPGARLRAAAAEGRTGEVEMLLDRGTSVDAADSDGDTALMKSVQADHPAVVSLLRRHGASRERKNHAGQSASDLAKAQADTALNRAMGLQPPP